MKRKYVCKMCGAKSPIFTRQKSMIRHIFSHETSISFEEADEKIQEYFEEIKYVSTSSNSNYRISVNRPKRRSKRSERIRQLE